MMKKIHYIIFTVLLLIGFTPLVKAEGTCSSTMLYDEKVNASEVAVSYDVITKTITDENSEPTEYETYYLKLKISNVPDNVEIQVSSLDKKIDPFTLKSSQRNASNEIYIDDYNTNTIKRLQFDIVSTSSDCSGEKLKTVTLNTPMFNEFGRLPICSQYPDFKYCDVFTEYDISSLTTTEFNKELESYKDSINEEENKEEKATEKVTKTMKKYWYVALIMVVILGALVATVIVIKKKRSRII